MQEQEVIQVEAGELIAAMRQHRATVERFQQAVSQLDDSLAHTMQFLSSWIDRLESLHKINGGVR